MATRAQTRTARAVAVLLALSVAPPACSRTNTSDPAPTDGRPPGSPGVVAEVIDGDTVDITIGGETERVRLLGIDTPETVKPGVEVECYGPEASARLHQLLPTGREVALQRDVEARDRYGRLLAYIWLADDGTFVNRSLLDDGFARPLSIEPNHAWRQELAAASADARRRRAGLWGSCPADG